MLKNFSKFLLVSLLIFIITSASYICFADEPQEVTTNAVTTSEDTTVTTSDENEEDNEHYGDLYLLDANVVIDKIIYGNVYVVSNKVTITENGQIEGNLFVCTPKLDFNGYVGGSIFAFTYDTYYNGASTYFYAATNKLDMTYNSYVIRDINSTASNIIFKSAIGRDANLSAKNIDFGKDEDIPVVYGKLSYNTPKEIEIPTGVVEDVNTQVTYSKLNNDLGSILDIIAGFLICITTAIVLYFIFKRVSPNFIEKLNNKYIVSIVSLIKSFVIGIIITILVLLVSLVLLLLSIGSNLALILLLLYSIICIISVPALSISITSSLKSVLKIEKTTMFCLILALVSVILYGITLIPFVGVVLGIIIKLTSIGLLVSLYIPHKELTDDEKTAKKEAKKLVKANKEKLKKEKSENKATKKQIKADTKVKKDNKE